MTVNTDNRAWISLAAAARLGTVAPSTMRELARQGKFASQLVGRRRRYRRLDVLAYLDRATTPGAATPPPSAVPSATIETAAA